MRQQGNLLSTTDPLGRTTRFEYDATYNRTAVIHPDKTKRSYAFNALGQLIAETNELGHTTKREYDAYGNLTAITDPAGHTTRTLFGSGDDSSPNLKADDSSALHGYAALHRPTGTVSAAGIRTQIEYDILGRRIALTKAPGTPEAATTKFEFDAVGNELQSTSPTGQVTRHTYDARKRRITTTDALNRTWRFAYNDAAGPSGPAPCCGADPTSNTRAAEVIHPDGSREQKIYNVQGQLIATTNAKGDTVKFAYDADGRLTELTDANGHTTKWRYGARGKLAAKTYPDNTTELYEHDAAGQMISRVRPDGTSARHTYDDRSHLLKIEWRDGKTENSTFAYDMAGHLTLAQNNSATIQRRYNAAGRMEKETQQISSSVAPQLDQPFTAAIGYQYDADGRLAQLTHPDQTTVSYRYNERGELSEVQDSMPQAPGSKPGTARYTRRPDGKITQLALSNGTVSTKTYDEVGRLAEIKHLDPTGAILFSETSRYDLNNRRTARVQADGSADLFAYDPAGQVTAAAYGQAAIAVAITAPRDEPQHAGAAAQNQKSTVGFKPQQTFAYDAAGNRLAATDGNAKTEYQSNAANQYTQIESLASGQSVVMEPVFDKLGNLLHDDKNTYTWDADIHLLSVMSKAELGNQKSEIKESFRYDALHRRVARHESASNTTTFFVTDGWNIIAEYQRSPEVRLAGAQQLAGSKTDRVVGTASNPPPDGLKHGTTFSPSLRNVWGEDLSGILQGAGGIGGLLVTVQSDAAHNRKLSTINFHYDSNGNVIRLTDAQGKESARYRYDAFGKTILAQGPAAERNRYRFSTKPVEVGCGLAYYGYRYYSPELGRWPSRDPIEEDGGINLYGMANNNTIDQVDIDGRVFFVIFMLGVKTYSYTEAAINGLLTCFSCHECGLCYNRSVDIAHQYYQTLSQQQYLEFMKSNGRECAELCAKCGDYAFKTVKWVLGSVVVTYGIKRSNGSFGTSME